MQIRDVLIVSANTESESSTYELPVAYMESEKRAAVLIHKSSTAIVSVESILTLANAKAYIDDSTTDLEVIIAFQHLTLRIRHFR